MMSSFSSEGNHHSIIASSSSKSELSVHRRSVPNLGHNASSPSTGSLDFEFASCSLLEDLPASPKLIIPSTTNSWGGLPNYDGRLELIMQQSAYPLPSPPPHTPVMNARQQPSAPSSLSLRQIMAEELAMGGDHKGYDFDSALQTPNLQQKQPAGPGQDVSSLRDINVDPIIKRKSAVLERRALMELSPLMMQKQAYLAGGLEDNSHLSSSNGSSAAVHPVNIDEFDHLMDQAATKISMKKHSSNSNKKWALKDLLRWTVPSSRSNSELNQSSKYANQKFESPRQSTSTLINYPKPYYLVSSRLSKSAPISPAASPPRSSTAPAVHVPATLGRPSPTRSPARPPAMSPQALHYKQQKAHSDELRKKTFLPYRQSLLGCLGGATMPEHVW